VTIGATTLSGVGTLNSWENSFEAHVELGTNRTG